ncbi:Dabb family protein [Aeromicrobium sp. Marseille-Q0843]|uniref:Dabb family protein n=1 Tax=Aeromicrobium phoceense TaxID=2754045 RepID=A0A838XKI0_9ACTN|nr:Dabb family protein [Aeromicrobium phoceense]MBA4609126.1 Dabb family protein [Aeromicrobium phoceense]
MITHVWSMTFTDASTPEQREALVAAMADLPNQIDGVASFRSGQDLGLNPGNAEVGIVAEFADEQAWRSYLEAPAHVAFVDDHVTPLCASWGAFQLHTA